MPRLFRHQPQILGSGRHDVAVAANEVAPLRACHRRKEAKDRESPLSIGAGNLDGRPGYDQLHLAAVPAEREDTRAPHIESALNEGNGTLVGALGIAEDQRAERLRKILRELTFAGIVNREARAQLSARRIEQEVVLGDRPDLVPGFFGQVAEVFRHRRLHVRRGVFGAEIDARSLAVSDQDGVQAVREFLDKCCGRARLLRMNHGLIVGKLAQRLPACGVMENPCRRQDTDELCLAFGGEDIQ